MTDPDAYREMARDLRGRARTMKSREAQADPRLLADEYDTLAAHLAPKVAPRKSSGQVGNKDKGDDPG